MSKRLEKAKLCAQSIIYIADGDEIDVKSADFSISFIDWKAPPAEQKLTLEVRGDVTTDDVLKIIRRIVKKNRDEGVPNIACEMQPRVAFLLARQLNRDCGELDNIDDGE
jgi:hypothetical protein